MPKAPSRVSSSKQPLRPTLDVGHCSLAETLIHPFGKSAEFGLQLSPNDACLTVPNHVPQNFVFGDVNCRAHSLQLHFESSGQSGATRKAAPIEAELDAVPDLSNRSFGGQSQRRIPFQIRGPCSSVSPRLYGFYPLPVEWLFLKSDCAPYDAHRATKRH